MLENVIVPDEENPLLRRLPSGQFNFASDPGREVSAARYFAIEINSGRLSSEAAVAYFFYSRMSETSYGGIINIDPETINDGILKLLYEIILSEEERAKLSSFGYSEALLQKRELLLEWIRQKTERIESLKHCSMPEYIAETSGFTAECGEKIDDFRRAVKQEAIAAFEKYRTRA